MPKRNVAIENYVIGVFWDVDGEEVITGTPSGSYITDGVGGDLTGEAVYDEDLKAWVWDEIPQAVMNGRMVGLKFELADAYSICDKILTDDDTADIAAIKAKTDNLPASPAAQGKLDTVEARLTAGRATALDNLDATVSSRLASGSYTAPDNAGITSIKAKTDNLTANPVDVTDLAGLASQASVDDVADELAVIDGKIDALSVDAGIPGPGADQVTIRITEDGTPGGVPVADVDVWVKASNAEGAQTIAGTLQTNSAGKVTFLLDAGETYYLWAQNDGHIDIQGVPFVAEAD